MSPSVDNGDNGTSGDEQGWFGRIVRVKLLGTVFVVLLLLFGYAYFFVDDHVEWILESTLSRGIGAEVNVGDLRTGWLTPGVRIDNVRVTDPKAPDRNIVEVDELSVGLNLDALLRTKVVVEESALRGVGFNTQRETPGWVAEEDGDWSWILTTTRTLLEDSYRRQTEGTFLGDVSGLLQGKTPDDLLDQYRSLLNAPSRLEELRNRIDEKRDSLRKRVDELPDKKDLDEIRSKVEGLKNRKGDLGALVQGTSDLKKIRDQLKDLKTKLEQFKSEYESASSSLVDGTRNLEETVSSDRATLRKQFSLPSLNLENPSGDLFDQFVKERLGRLHGVLEYVKPYLPTGGTPGKQPPGKTGSAKKPTPQYAEGIGRSYRFPTPEGYPSFWLKRFDFGTKGSTNDSINLWGNIKNVSTYPPAVGEPVEGTFEVSGLTRRARSVSGQFRSVPEELTYSLALKELELSDWKLAGGESFELGLGGTTGQLDYSGVSSEGTTRSTLELTVPSPSFNVRTPRESMTRALRDSLNGIDKLWVRAELNSSESSSPSITSNLDDALRSALSGYLRNELSSAREKLVRQYNEAVVGKRKELESRIGAFRDRYESLLAEKRKELDAITDRINEKVETEKSKLKIPDFSGLKIR